MKLHLGPAGKKLDHVRLYSSERGAGMLEARAWWRIARYFPIMDNVVYPSCGYESASTLLSGAVRLAFAQQGSRLDIGGGQGIMVETVLAR